MASLDYTGLNFWKTTSRLDLDVDLQIGQFIRSLQGKIKENWQVLAPSPNVRVIYFEMQEGASKPKQVEGYQEHIRDLQEGNVDKALGIKTSKTKKN